MNKKILAVPAIVGSLMIAGATTAMAQDAMTSATNSTATSAPAHKADNAPGGAQDQGVHGHAKDGKDGPGRPHGIDDAALATKLGLTQQQVTDAFTKVEQAHKAEMEANKAAGKEPSPESVQDREAKRAEMDKQLAAALGVDATKLKDAMTSLHQEEEAQHKAQHRTELSSQLDSAVSAGKLTAGDKDSVLKAFDQGVLDGPGGKGGHGVGRPGGRGPQDGQGAPEHAPTGARTAAPVVGSSTGNAA